MLLDGLFFRFTRSVPVSMWNLWSRLRKAFFPWSLPTLVLRKSCPTGPAWCHKQRYWGTTVIVGMPVKQDYLRGKFCDQFFASRLQNFTYWFELAGQPFSCRILMLFKVCTAQRPTHLWGQLRWLPQAAVYSEGIHLVASTLLLLLPFYSPIPLLDDMMWLCRLICVSTEQQGTLTWQLSFAPENIF